MRAGTFWPIPTVACYAATAFRHGVHHRCSHHPGFRRWPQDRARECAPRGRDVHESIDIETGIDIDIDIDVDVHEAGTGSLLHQHPCTGAGPAVGMRDDSGIWEGLGEGFEIQSRATWWLIASVLPHPGIQATGGLRTSLALSWPWSLPLGPDSATQIRKRRCSSDSVDTYKPNRLVAELGVVFKDETTVFLRPGYRFLYHPEAWSVGIGIGLGSTLELRGQDGLRASLSPEAVVQLGACCKPLYVTAAVRYDAFFSGDSRHALTVSIGLTYF